MFLKHGITPETWNNTDIFDLMDILSVPDENPAPPEAHDGGFYDTVEWDD